MNKLTTVFVLMLISVTVYAADGGYYSGGKYGDPNAKDGGYYSGGKYGDPNTNNNSPYGDHSSDHEKNTSSDRSSSRHASSGTVFVRNGCPEIWKDWAYMCCNMYQDRDSCEKHTSKKCVTVDSGSLRERYEQVKRTSTTAPACEGN